MNIEKNLNLLKKDNKIVSRDSVIYVLTAKKKSNTLFKFVDFFTGGAADLLANQTDSADRFSYLIASSSGGKVYRINEDSNIEYCFDIKDWDMSMKENFKSTEVDGIIYKKVRKVNV